MPEASGSLLGSIRSVNSFHCPSPSRVTVMRTSPLSPERDSLTEKSPDRHLLLSEESRSLTRAVGLPNQGLFAENCVFQFVESQVIPPSTSLSVPNVPSPHVVPPREMVPPLPVSLRVNTTVAGIDELLVMHSRTPRLEASFCTAADSEGCPQEATPTAVRLTSAAIRTAIEVEVTGLVCPAPVAAYRVGDRITPA